MAVRLAAATANSMATAIAAAVDLQTGAGTIKVYTGTQPVTGDSAETGSLLATFTLATTAFTGPSSGQLTLASTPLTVAAAATGTAGWFRLEDASGNNVLDGTVGTSGQQLNLNTLSITNGVNVTITSGTITVPTQAP